MSKARLESVKEAGAEPVDAPDLRGGEEASDGGDALDTVELGPDCPVQPLGFLKQKNHFLDWKGQLIELGTEFRKGEVMQLFGTRLSWAENQWPQWKMTGEKEIGGKKVPQFEPVPKAFDQKAAQRSLILACSKAGLFDPKNKVRGRGAWRGDDGELILHCGDRVLVGGRRGTRGREIKSQWFKSGLHGDYVYPTAPAIRAPADQPSPVEVGAQILKELGSWNWKRKEIDPYLLFCWIATACVGGASRIRPHGWITGPSGAGKTTLQNFLRELMGDWGIFTEDATEAGVRQLLDQDSLAVMFDEIEAEEGNQDVVYKIVRLARLAYSGASSVRGSSDHQAKQFVARSCFLFSSIHHHELPAQDRNRIAILHLAKFPPNTKQFVLPAMARIWGDQLRRRMIEQWHRYDETLRYYQQEMMAQGYTGREQDTYGTLLACGDLLLHDKKPWDGSLDDMVSEQNRVTEWVAKLAKVVDSVRAEAEDTAERCIRHLASFRLPGQRGESPETVARWIAKAIIAIENKAPNPVAKGKLATHGLRLVNLSPKHHEGNGQGGLMEGYLTSALYLAVANKTNKGVQELFADSMWAGGVWSQSLQLVEGAIANKKSRFAGGPPEGCVLIPLKDNFDVEAAISEAADLARQESFGGV